MQHKKLCSFTAHEKQHFTYQANHRFYSIHIWQLWYWDNITRIFVFNITTEYHLQKEQSRWRRKEKSATNDSKVNQTNKRELSDKWSPINASSHIKPKGNADSKQRLTNSQKFFKLHRKSEQRRIINNKTSFRQQNKGSITTGAETKSSSENRRIFLPRFYTKAMRSSQAFIHTRMRSCTTHHLHVWEHV